MTTSDVFYGELDQRRVTLNDGLNKPIDHVLRLSTRRIPTASHLIFEECNEVLAKDPSARLADRAIGPIQRVDDTTRQLVRLIDSSVLRSSVVPPVNRFNVPIQTTPAWETCSEAETLFAAALAAVQPSPAGRPEDNEGCPITIFVNPRGTPIFFKKNCGEPTALSLRRFAQQVDYPAGTIVDVHTSSGVDRTNSYFDEDRISPVSYLEGPRHKKVIGQTVVNGQVCRVISTDEISALHPYRLSMHAGRSRESRERFIVHDDIGTRREALPVLSMRNFRTAANLVLRQL